MLHATMRRIHRGLRIGLLAATAVSGLVGGHLLDYWILIPDPGHRHELLARTGHQYLTRVTMLTVGLAVIVAFVAVALGILRGRAGSGHGFGVSSIARVAGAQAVGFIVLEAAERLASGVPGHHLTDAVVIAGVGLQLIVGALAALVLLVLERVGVGIGTKTVRRRRFARTAGSFVAPRAAAVRTLWLRAPHPIRGPPVLLRS